MLQAAPELVDGEKPFLDVYKKLFSIPYSSFKSRVEKTSLPTKKNCSFVASTNTKRP